MPLIDRLRTRRNRNLPTLAFNITPNDSTPLFRLARITRQSTECCGYGLQTLRTKFLLPGSGRKLLSHTMRLRAAELVMPHATRRTCRDVQTSFLTNFGWLMMATE